ncbi:MAG TPA: phosphopantetheine-binding protein, partial [Kineosporiaceae bacterium]|nr:phosphopantetheine-binding protein [Kineosporiaceae bacterium]
MSESPIGAAAEADRVDGLAAVPERASGRRPEAADVSSSTERALAGLLAEVLGVERVPPDGHFFDDLGADSMVMARFCARVRKRPDLPPVSMKEVYQNPSVRSLSQAVAGPPDAVVPPPEATGVVSALAAVLAEVLGVEQVAEDAHLFDDLGADSMVMARFCARIRKR